MGDETGISSNSWRMKNVWCWIIPRASQRKYYFISKSSTRVLLEDLVRVFAEFHNSGIINQNTNASFIVLLPKKSRSKKISDFRPINLITCLFKVIAKVLSGHLRGVLHETIHSTQGAFVQGRQILDAVLMANEIVDEKRRSREEGVVFKIDFEKAYDHVKWDFLDHMLEKKGFSLKWRSWMRGCLSSVSFAILVNGNAKGRVKASRGLRQGDPLSPFLLTIVVDVLSRMLLKTEERSLLKGFRDPVIERISKRLDGWKKAHLSLGGRITLLHSCLSHIPSYFLSLFKIPASVAAKVERMQRDFLWSLVGEGKRDHLVRWDAVCKPRVKGGLGIGKIPLRNRALLGKWLWRFPKESTTLWHQVILSIYGTHSNSWDVNTVVRWSHRCPWKAIAQVFQDFSKYTQFIVGDGERIRFWEDLW
ncbi:putative ribonuclease H protein [Vitis vinifera]|uniref:Putative ribonuclease H protein n=1 Tax=Vitis vinifera TaxID=29760 RepID=A0A438JMZ0_VITVI|nr:putative ribonuclease H protein [Vitis vinifera]